MLPGICRSINVQRQLLLAQRSAQVPLQTAAVHQPNRPCAPGRCLQNRLSGRSRLSWGIHWQLASRFGQPDPTSLRAHKTVRLKKENSVPQVIPVFGQHKLKMFGQQLRSRPYKPTACIRYLPRRPHNSCWLENPVLTAARLQLPLHFAAHRFEHRLPLWLKL